MTAGAGDMLAPAKINLCLHVTGRREDGYHLIDSLVVFADAGAADGLQLSPAAVDSFKLTGPFAAALADAHPDDNLVVAARDWLREQAGDTPTPPVALTLEKNLPVASGLGGGSADGAAALRLLAEHWSIPIETIAAHTVELGADVPMCLESAALRARGIGDRLTTLPHLPTMDAVLVNPGIGVSTPAVFAGLDKRDNPPVPDLPDDGLEDASVLAEWLALNTRNDLEQPARAKHPAIGDLLHALSANGALLARMSGSGATCFGLFETAEEADAAARALTRPGRWVRRSRLNAAAPAGATKRAHADA